jgi:hypothetical protein
MMLMLVKRFLYPVFHPFIAQRGYRALRSGDHFSMPIDATQIRQGFFAEAGQSLDLHYMIPMAWLIQIFPALYRLATIHIGILLGHGAVEPGFLVSAFPGLEKLFALKPLLLFIMFPLLLLSAYYFWMVCLRAVTGLMTRDPERKEVCREISRTALGSCLFHIIPLVGPLVATVSHMFILYAGLTQNLRLSRAQAIVSIISPIFIFGMVIASSILLVVLGMTGFIALLPWSL